MYWRMIFVLTLMAPFNHQAVASVAKSEKMTIKVDDRIIDVMLNSDDGAHAKPLLVIAPAKKYLMQEPIFEELAQLAASIGYFVVRFNWSFARRDAEPSADLGTEDADLNGVISHFLKQRKVAKENTVIAAKSFGTKVLAKGAYKLASAVMLITPNCDERDTFAKVYGPIFTADMPVNVTISATDPFCDVRQIYDVGRFLQREKFTISTLFGGHNFEGQDHVGSHGDTAIAVMMNWLALMFRRNAF